MQESFYANTISLGASASVVHFCVSEEQSKLNEVVLLKDFTEQG